jgi:2-oxoglutarate ferredoxin oxidoreductase subunit alpha
MRENISIPEAGELEVIDRIKPEVPQEWYIPYEETSSGVPAMGVFGEGYRYHVTGLVHDVRGFPTTREDEVNTLMNRLFRKISSNMKEIQTAETFRMEDAEIAVVAYGSTARSAKRAVIMAREAGKKAGLLRLISLWPFCRQAVESILDRCHILVVAEMNFGQVSREVKRVARDRVQVRTVNRILGRLVRPEEILAAM